MNIPSHPESESSLDIVEMPVEGMHCAHCAQSVAHRLSQIGLKRVTVDFATSSALFIPGDVPLTRIREAIRDLGYRVPEADRPAKFSISLELKFLICALFTAPLLAHMFIQSHFLHHHLTQLALATPVVLLAILHFGKSAWNSVRNSNPNMDVLIIIGVLAAYGYSLYGSLLGLGEDFVFYETAAAITTFVLLGNVMEKRSLKKTSSAIEELTRLQPQRARRVTGQGALKQVDDIPLTSVKAGDILQVNSGDQIPTDGTVTEGECLIDESIITGESIPQLRRQQDKVIGGTVVIEGNAYLQATEVGEHTLLQQIIRLVRQSTGSRPRIQRLGDKVSAIFVPVVVAISLLTFTLAYWAFDLSFATAMLQSVAVLVVACPCAMGLATPTAVAVGIGRAARNGILIKGGATLETLSQVETVIFDKTGTLTNGAFRIQELKLHNGAEETEVRSLIKSIEIFSSHPIAHSLVRELAMAPTCELTDVQETKGMGISARDSAGSLIRLGSPRFLEATEAHAHEDLLLERGGVILAAIRLIDDLKPGSIEAISWLKNHGKKVVIISGDTPSKVQSVAEVLGVSTFHARTLPHEKLALIKEISKTSRTCFVGDGVNDAPALTQADVGISLGGATQAAIQSSDIILLDGSISRLIDALQISTTTVKTIKENLFWAFFYNSLSIPVAAFGYLTPLVAALAMAFSDVIVIGNSIRLRVRSLG